jgi:hypothetical protein
MNLGELFEQLSHGELSTVALGGMNDGFGIREEDYEKVVSHVNYALLELHKKFQLKVVTVELPIEAGSHTYLLDADMLNIISIADQDGFPYSLNRINASYPEYNVSTDNTGFTYNNTENVAGTFKVTYKASITKIDPIGLVPEDVELDIHPGALQPLLNLIASRVYASLPSLEGVNKSAEYYSKYLNDCQNIQMYGLVHNAEFENTKLEDRGWV